VNRLDLDLRPTRPASRAGWIVLGLALVALLDLGATLRQMDGELTAAQRGGAARGRAATGLAQGGKAGAEALGEADRIARSLTLPWDTLFRSVEEATDDRVALLALQPDPQKRELTISGEAKDYAAILAFVERLDGREALRDVHLVKHEIREDDPQRPTYFNIVASWKAGT
jgi:hypothetical protein